MAKPNIFSFATKELSQDAFFAWLVAWADKSNEAIDPQLHAVAQDFVRLLILKQFPDDEPIIITVEPIRQYHGIDILVKVDNTYVIAIEDKTNSGEHSNQLVRYKDQVEIDFPQAKQALIYLKTGNESRHYLGAVEKSGFKSVNRKSILDVLGKLKATNYLFNDFLDFYGNIESQSNDYDTLRKITSIFYAAQGFYQALEEIMDDCGWTYVNNPNGGFLCFWGLESNTEKFKLYVQLENYVNKDLSGFKVVVKINSWSPSTDVLWSILHPLKSIAESNGLTLEKPYKFKAGQTSTIAVLHNAFPQDLDASFDLKEFVLTIKTLGNTIATFCKESSATV